MDDKRTTDFFALKQIARRDGRLEPSLNAAHSIFGIDADRKHTLKWLFH